MDPRKDDSAPAAAPRDPPPLAPFGPGAALLLVDLQRDFLAAEGLEPEAPAVVAAAARLLEGWRARGLPVVHVVTTVRREPDDRMPHWRRAGRWACVAGTPGHAPPPLLAPRAGEPVIEKRFFGAFGTGALDQPLRERGIERLVVAGVHLHGCVRASVLEAYERGLDVVVAVDAVASDDPPHAAISRRWLEARAARFAPVAEILAALAPAPLTGA